MVEPLEVSEQVDSVDIDEFSKWVKVDRITVVSLVHFYQAICNSTPTDLVGQQLYVQDFIGTYCGQTKIQYLMFYQENQTSVRMSINRLV